MNRTPLPPSDRPLPDGNDIRLPWHLGLPPALESAFRDYLHTLSRRAIRSSFLLVLLLLVAGSLVEALVEPATALQTWRARLLAIMAVAAAWWVASTRQSMTQTELAVGFAALVIAASNNYLAGTIEHALSYTYYLFNLLAIMLMGTLFRITVRAATLVSALIMTLMALSMLAFSALQGTVMLSLFFFVFCGGILSLHGQYSFEKLQRQYFLSERVLAMHRSELHSANLVLENQASEDPLTGTVNRRGMEERLGRLIHQQKQRGSQEGGLFAILFDIDFFKQYNDSYGHLAGDGCLRTVSSIVQSMIQSETDFVARYGGEEFLVVLDGIRLNDALVFAERMRDRIEKQGMEHRSSRCSNVVTISVGVASWRRQIQQSSELINLADEALYEAKRLGRNRVVMIDDNDSLRQL